MNGPTGGSSLGLADPERENALLVGLIEAISAGPELLPLASNVARLIVHATATDVCYVHVLDDSGGSLTLAGATPPFDGQVGRVRLPLGEGVAGWVASHRRPAVIPEDKRSDPRYLGVPGLAGTDYTSMAAVPMASKPGGLVGVLSVHTRQRRDFTGRDVRLLTSIGSLVAGAMHQARMHRRLAARERAAERFAEQVIAAQEAERRRLAGDIHDGITQRLVSLTYHLDAVGDAVAASSGFAAEQLAMARELADVTIDEARAAISGLRPPVLEDLGLSDGLASLARSVSTVGVRLNVAECRLPEHVEIALYRIAQEALQNVVKHSSAAHAELELRCDGGEAVLRVADDGRGFDHAALPDSTPAERSYGYGMRSMTERAELVGGRLEVTSRPGLGTVVTAVVPLRPGHDTAGSDSAAAGRTGRRPELMVPPEPVAGGPPGADGPPGAGGGPPGAGGGA